LKGIILFAIVALGGALIGFAYRGDMDFADLRDSNLKVLKFRAGNDELKSHIANLNGKVNALQAELRSHQAVLDAMKPSKNTYRLKPNQSMIVAGGHLTIGLIGAPLDESIKINVNGKKYSAVVGDVIHIVPDPLRNCRVTVQSFDTFEAILAASCSAAKQ
jgi:hypothetical protein